MSVVLPQPRVGAVTCSTAAVVPCARCVRASVCSDPTCPPTPHVPPPLPLPSRPVSPSLPCHRAIAPPHLAVLSASVPAGASFNPNQQERALQSSILSAAQQKKLKGGQRPAWAYTAEAKVRGGGGGGAAAAAALVVVVLVLALVLDSAGSCASAGIGGWSRWAIAVAVAVAVALPAVRVVARGAVRRMRVWYSRLAVALPPTHLNPAPHDFSPCHVTTLPRPYHHPITTLPPSPRQEKAEEDEADELLRFAESLDFDAYLDDLEVRTAMEQAKAQLEALEQERVADVHMAAAAARAAAAEERQAQAQASGEHQPGGGKVTALTADSLRQVRGRCACRRARYVAGGSGGAACCGGWGRWLPRHRVAWVARCLM